MLLSYLFCVCSFIRLIFLCGLLYRKNIAIKLKGSSLTYYITILYCIHIVYIHIPCMEYSCVFTCVFII